MYYENNITNLIFKISLLMFIDFILNVFHLISI